MKLYIFTTYLLHYLLQSTVSGDCPAMYYRFQWGAATPRNQIPMPTPIPNMVIHHSATRTCVDVPDCMAIIKSFQTNHMTERGWDDIAYSFLIGGDGNLYEGRGWKNQVQGTQPPEWNYLGYTVCIIGTFEDELPTLRQMEVAQQVIQCAIEGNYVPGNYSLRGHRDVYPDTACPGETFYNEIQSWPHYHNASH